MRNRIEEFRALPEYWRLYILALENKLKDLAIRLQGSHHMADKAAADSAALLDRLNSGGTGK